MRYVYTAIFSQEPETEETYNVSFPDIPGCNTFGEGLVDAIDMAEDALCLWLYDKEECSAAIPPATVPSKVTAGGGAFVTAISVDTETYRRYHSNKLIKKTLNVPMWLNEMAEKKGINFSQALQQSLKDQLGVQDCT